MTNDPQDPSQGFYGDQYDEEEQARMTGAGRADLTDEIAMQRVMNHRLLERMQGEDLDALPLAELLDLSKAVTAGNARLAQLVKDQQALEAQRDPREDDRTPLERAWALSVVEMMKEFGFKDRDPLTPAFFAEAGIPWPFDMPAFLDMQMYLGNTRPTMCSECPAWDEEGFPAQRTETPRHRKVADQIRAKWGKQAQVEEREEGEGG